MKFTGFISKLVFSVLFTFSLFVSAAVRDVVPGEVTDDRELQQAMRTQRQQQYVEAGNLTVSKLLPDDTVGLPHQKWEAKLSNGAKILVVYNLDMGKKVPLEVGKKFAVGGEFIWTKTGGLVHWTHFDDRGRRPDGYVYYEGVAYGFEESESSEGSFK